MNPLLGAEMPETPEAILAIKEDHPPVLFFDGVCNLCNGFVDFMVRHDSRRTYRYAPLQGWTAKRNIPDEVVGGRVGSVVLLKEGFIYVKSEAALRAISDLGGAWRILKVLLVIPGPIRDGIYALIAKHRYRLFGKADACRLPNPQEQSLFLP